MLLNGICERFYKTILNEFYQVTFRKKLYGDIDTLQSDLEEWLLTIIMSEPIRENGVVAEHRGKHDLMVNASGLRKT